MAHGFKTGGRTKGTPNKVTQEVRETLQEILDNELTEIPALLATLEPKDRLSFVIKLLPYVIPKLKPEIPEAEDRGGASVESFLDQFRNVDVRENIKPKVKPDTPETEHERPSYGGFIHKFKNGSAEDTDN